MMKKSLLLSAIVASFMGLANATPVSLNLLGNADYDGWYNLTYSGGYSGIMFPGTGDWKTSGGSWTSYNNGTTTVGAIGSNTADSGDALLYKVSNGAAGGPYPAGESIYFGGASATTNYNGGTLGVVDTTPVAGVNTVAFQVNIGEAWGYDFYNHVLPVLKYTTADGTGTLEATYSSLISQVYTGAIMMPTGYEDVYRNTWGVQFDLSLISDEIISFELQFTGVQHAQLYGLQLDQTDAIYQSTVFPQDKHWTAGGSDNIWSSSQNWAGNSVPQGDSVSFGVGSEVVVDSDRTVTGLKLTSTEGFAVTSTNDATLTIGQGGIVVDSDGVGASYSIDGNLVFSTFNLITIGENDSLVISADLSGPGFYKKGEGSLSLEGNNAYYDSSFNQLLFSGGTNYVSGTNTNKGLADFEVNVKDAVLVLRGGDNRFGEGFRLELMSSSIVNGSEPVSSATGHLVLGDEGGKSDQTFAGIESAKTNVFNEAVGYAMPAADSNSTITGGNEEISTLTTKVASGQSVEYWGHLGGDGENQNNLALVKSGDGSQALGGTSTYVGDTRIEGGMLRIDSATALSQNSNVQLNGGVLGLGAQNLTANLGTGAGEIQFTGDGGFAGHGAARTVTLNGGAALTWGSGGFIGNGRKLILSHVAANNVVELTNAIDLGSAKRTVQVDNGSGSIDGRFSGVLSGTGGIEKTGAGTLELTAANDYTGGTDIREGILALTGSNGSIKGDVIIGAGAALNVSNTAAANNGNRLEDTAVVTMNAGILNFINPTGATGTTSYSETFGELKVNGGANVVFTSQTGTSGTNTGTLTIGALSRTAGATVNFSGTSLGLSARNRILVANAPVLNNGIIGGWATVGNEFATYGANGIAALTSYTTGAENTWASTSNVKVSGSTSSTTTTLTGSRTVNSLNVTGPTSGSNVSNTIALNGNTLRIRSGGLLTSGGSSLRTSRISDGMLTAGADENTAGELIVVSNGYAVIDAQIVDNGSGAVSLVKSGASNLALSNANTYTGGTTVNQGTLAINNANAIGTGTLTLNNNAVLDNSSGAAITLATNNQQIWNGNFTFLGANSLNLGTGGVTLTGNHRVTVNANTLTVGAVSGSYSLTKAGNGTLAFSGESNHSGGTIITGGTLAVGTGGTSGSLVGDVSGTAGTLAFDRADNVGYDGTVSGAIGLTKQGTGDLILFGDNTYTGNTTLTAGALVLGSEGAISDRGSIVFNGGVLRYTEANTTDYSGRFGTLAAGNSARIDTNGQDIVFDSIISGLGGLEKLGEGSLTLNAANTFSGDTLISGGLLVLGNANALQNSNVILNGGAIDYGAFNDVSLGGLTGTSDQTLNEGVTFIIGNADAASNSLYEGSLSGGGSLKKEGNSTLILSGSSSYTGGTSIAGGVVRAAHDSALGSGAVNVAASGTLVIDQSVMLANNVAVASGSVDRAVSEGAAYNLGTSGSVISANAQGEATSVNILGGNASSDTNLVFSLKTQVSNSGFATNDGARVSDVFSLHGSGNDILVLQLSVGAGITEASYLAWFDGESWVNAVQGNFEGNSALNNALTEQQGFQGSFALFQQGNGVDFLGYGTDLSDYVGAWGVDVSSGAVWAVINHNSDFSAVPEPQTWLLVGIGVAFLLWGRRRRSARMA